MYISLVIYVCDSYIMADFVVPEAKQPFIVTILSLYLKDLVKL